MSQDTLNAMELATLKALLRKARASGLTAESLDVVTSNKPSPHNVSTASWDFASGGAMTDGSKRHLSPDPAARAKTGKTRVNALMVSSLSPENWKQLEEIGKNQLHSDLGSVLQWSQAMITFGKLKAQEMSYLELAISRDAEHVSYVKWVRACQRSFVSPQLSDLARFMEVINEVIPLSGAKKVFAGTSIEHRFKVQ